MLYILQGYQMIKKYKLIYLLILFFAVCLCTIFSIALGPVPISIFNLTGDTQSLIIFNIRLPRAIAAALCGAGLAGAGTAMQALFRNDLADPYILGTSAGGAVGVSLVMALGLFMNTLGGIYRGYNFSFSCMSSGIQEWKN